MGVIWDMDIRVTGSREKFQSDLNFSIQVEDVHNIPQIAELRRRFFKEFEDSDRGEDLRVLTPKVVKDKKEITENTSINKSVASGDGTVNNTGNFENIGSTGIAESYAELENTGDSLEDILKDISTNGVFGENRKSDNSEGTELDVGKIDQSSEGTNLETGNVVSFKESIKQRREGIVLSSESSESNGEEYNGSMKDTKQKVEGINQKSENNEDKEKNIKQTQEVNKSEVGKTKNRNGIIYVEVKYDDDGWAYGESTDEDEIEDKDLGNEDTDDFPTEDEFGDNDDIFNDAVDANVDENESVDDDVDDDVDDFPDNDFDEDAEDTDGDFEGKEEVDDIDFPDVDDCNDDVDFQEETDKDGDETEEIQDSEEDDPFSSWGNDFDEDEDNEDDDFSPMDSSDDVEDSDYNQSDSKAAKNFLDMVKSKTKEGIKEDKEDEKKEKAIPINKGKSVDESWRKTSEVGDIDDLWSFDSMKDLSGDEFDNMLYGESELDKRCENCSDVEVPDVDEICKTREARKRIGNSKRGVDAVEVKESTNNIEVSEDDEEDIFGNLGFEDEEDMEKDEEDDDGIFGSLDFTDEEDVEEDESLTREIEKDIKGYDAENIYQKGNKQVITSNTQNQKPVVKEVKVEEKKVDRSDYKTLRDFVKANKGCTVSEALVLFSKKEIEKDLKMGRVYQRRDKLFI